MLVDSVGIELKECPEGKMFEIPFLLKIKTKENLYTVKKIIFK